MQIHVGVKADDECLFCKDKDSIEHTFIECSFTEKKVIPQWFYEANCCQISPTTEEPLFGIIPSSNETKLNYKFHYITLSIRHYIHVYSNKINSKGIYMHEFINKFLLITIWKKSIKTQYLK